MNTNWVSIADALPPFGQYVLCAHNRGTWNDSDDQARVNCVVLKRVPSNRGGNNFTDFEWRQFGPDSFYGQSITHWAEIDAPPLPLFHQFSDAAKDFYGRK